MHFGNIWGLNDARLLQYTILHARLRHRYYNAQCTARSHPHEWCSMISWQLRRFTKASDVSFERDDVLPIALIGRWETLTVACGTKIDVL